MVSLLIGLLAAGFIIIELFNIDFLNQFISIVILLFIILSLPYLRGAMLYIVSFVMVLTVILFWNQTDVFSLVLSGATINLPLVALFIFAPLLGIPVRTGEYVEALKLILQKWINNVWLFYICTHLLAHMLSVVISIGSVTISYNLKDASIVESKRLLSNALNRAFAMSIYWSPYFAAMALMINNLDVEWAEVVLYGLGFFVISFIVGILTELKTIRTESARLREVATKVEFKGSLTWEEAKKKVIELCILLVGTITIVLVIEGNSPFSMVLSISLTSMAFPILWCLLKGDLKKYIVEFKNHTFKTLPAMQKEITLFLLAGVLSAAFANSAISTQMLDWVNTHMSDSVMLLTIILTLFIVGTSALGLHPIIFMTILVTSVPPESIGVSHQYFAVLLLISWGFATTISPATVVNNLLATYLNTTLANVSYRWNLKFVLILSIILPFYLNILGI